MTRDQFTKVVSMLAVCREGPDWVYENDPTPEQAWTWCHRPEWMLFIVLRLAFFGGGDARAGLWSAYFNQLWGEWGWDLDDQHPTPNPTPAEIRAAVPWPMVRDALEREARKMGVIQ